MNITTEKNNSTLTSNVKIALQPEDYKVEVEKAIKEYGKKATLPGFRKGMVPAGHIRKMYGKSILYNKINDIVAESLRNYIFDNKLEVLGQPIPRYTENEYKWDLTDNFYFNFEIAVAPEVTIDIPTESFQKFTIVPDADTLEERMMNLRRAYGSMGTAEQIENGDVALCRFTELENNTEKANGISSTQSFRLDTLTEDVKNKVIGLKKGDSVVISDLKNNFSANVVAGIYGVEQDALDTIASNDSFKVEIVNISRIQPADFNEEFFKKVFPDKEITSAEDFKVAVIEELKNQFAAHSDNKLAFDIQKHIMDKVQFDLPEAFLKEWLATTRNNISNDEIEEGFEAFVKGLKWSIIEGKIAQQKELNISSADVIAMVKQRIASQLMMYSPTPFTDEQLNEYAARYLGDQNNMYQAREEARALKVFEFFKSNLKFEEKEIDYKAFLAIAEKEN